MTGDMSNSRHIGREIGTAFAVLAIYLLTVLAPLHHARASQLAFEQLGYATLETGWVLCTPTGSTGDDRDSLIAKCPATGVAKTDFVLPVGAIPAAPRDVAALTAPLSPSTHAFTPAPAAPPTGSRAPPVAV